VNPAAVALPPVSRTNQGSATRASASPVSDTPFAASSASKPDLGGRTVRPARSVPVATPVTPPPNPPRHGRP
jgi:hypothetical protein